MVEQPTVIFGKTQSGKTWRSFDLWRLHPGPAIFADIQWRAYLPGTHYTRTVEDVVAVLNGAKREHLLTGPKIAWRLNDYSELHTLIDYLITVHRARHERGQEIPTLAVFLDEAWKGAGRGANEQNPAVRLFSEGYQHQVVGVAISQWVAQIARLIPGNAYEFYIFKLWEKDEELLRTDYRMEVPDSHWLGDSKGCYPRPCSCGACGRYWRYDGEWWRGNSAGVEIRDGEDAVSKVPEESGEDKPDEKDVHPQQAEETAATGGRVDVSELQRFDEPGRSKRGASTEPLEEF